MRFRVLAVGLASFALACGSVEPDVAHPPAPPPVSPVEAPPPGNGGSGSGGGGSLATPTSPFSPPAAPTSTATAPPPSGVAAHIQANVSFLLKSVMPAGPFAANTTYDFTYEITIHSSHDENFHLVPEVDAGWTAVVQGSDVIAATVASAVAGLTVTKVISVTTGASGTGSLLVSVDGTKFATYTQSSQPTPITIGAAPVLPTADILVEHVVAIGTNYNEVRRNTVFVKRQPPAGKTGSFVLSVLALFGAVGSYEVSAVTFDSTDWQVKAPDGTAKTINVGAPGNTSNIAFTVQPKLEGGQLTAGDGNVAFTITPSGGGQPLAFTAKLRVVDVLP